MRILVVDDNEDLRIMLQAWLEAEGHDVAVAPDGAAALELLPRAAFDLVVTDLSMPNTDGLEIIVELRKRYPDIAIVAMSGWSLTEGVNYLDVAREIGAVRTLKKPFEPADLSAIVRDLGSRRTG